MRPRPVKPPWIQATVSWLGKLPLNCAVGKNTARVFEFLAAQRPFDLHAAMGKSSRDELVNELGKEKVEHQMHAYRWAQGHAWKGSLVDAMAEMNK